MPPVLLSLTRLLVSAVMLSGAVACFALACHQLFRVAYPVVSWEGIAFVMMLPLLFWMLVMLHELGHAVGAWLGGLRILRIIIGPFKWSYEAGSMRFGLNRSKYRMQGQVMALPSDDRNLARRMALFIAGGPGANLLAGAVCFLLARLLAPAGLVDPTSGARSLVFGTTPLGLGASWWLDMAAWFNGLLFFTNLWPAHINGVSTDGAKLIDWTLGGPGAEREALALVLQAALLAGMRPREWNTALVQRMLGLREQTIQDVAANFTAYYYYLDLGDRGKAAEHLQLALDQTKTISPGFRVPMLLEGAYYFGFLKRDLAEAEKCFRQAQGGDIEKQTWRRAEAALAFAAGRYAQAIAHAEAGLLLIPLSWDPGGSRAEKEWLEDIVTQSRAAALAPACST